MLKRPIIPSRVENHLNMSLESCFCNCPNDKGEMQCNCGEEIKDFEWAFEEPQLEVPVRLIVDRREARFQPTFSVGTVGLRGDKPLTPGSHYLWEIKMLKNVYGTDVMVGVGTAKVNLTECFFDFKSLLGENHESWGFSYRGRIHHDGKWKEYGCGFGRGSIIGVHLDLWNGMLEFYVNRKPMGIAFHLQPQVLYPMVSSTAADSAMRLISCSSWSNSLQFACLRSISLVPNLVELVISVPGFRSTWGNTLVWQFIKGRITKEEDAARDNQFQAEKHSQGKSEWVVDLSSSSEESEDMFHVLRRPKKKISGRRTRKYLRR